VASAVVAEEAAGPVDPLAEMVEVDVVAVAVAAEGKASVVEERLGRRRLDGRIETLFSLLWLDCIARILSLSLLLSTQLMAGDGNRLLESGGWVDE